jgi:hypothetical protein
LEKFFLPTWKVQTDLKPPCRCIERGRDLVNRLEDVGLNRLDEVRLEVSHLGYPGWPSLSPSSSGVLLWSSRLGPWWCRVEMSRFGLGFGPILLLSRPTYA